MTQFYSAKTGEFYDSRDHQSLPDDAVEIDDPNTILATKKYVDDTVQKSEEKIEQTVKENFAPINSPTFTGTPTTPTPDKEDCSEQVANTAFVQAKLNQHVGLGNMQVFDKDGEFTVPENCTRIKIRVWGGGGGGSSSTPNWHGSGGSGGGYAEGFFTVVPGTTLTVTVGAAGKGNIREGQTGGTSKVDPLISATGGEGGQIADRRAATEEVRILGGVGQGGDWQVPGLRGSFEPTFTGGAAYGSSGSQIVKIPGMTPGGGGAGNFYPSHSHTGGDGGAGLVIIEY